MPDIIDHDTWNYSPKKTPRAPRIVLDDIYGVLPFDGAHNPSGRSSWSQKVFLTYRTQANDWLPKVGMCESAAEMAVALEALVSPNTFDLAFQPLTVEYTGDYGKPIRYTHDLKITFATGHRRMVFVRYENSLAKPSTARKIKAIAAATPRSAADDLIVVNAADYPRQRRDNLFRMHKWVFSPDDEADEIVWEIARRDKSFYYMKDLFPKVPLAQPRVFQGCYRLIAKKQFSVNLNQIIWEYSKLEIAA